MEEINVKNQTIFCKDNLDILRGINSNSIPLIYLDPPFNTNKQWDAPIGSKAAGADFDDIWEEEDVKLEWLDIIEESQPEIHAFINGLKGMKLHSSNWAYICYMAIRLIEMKRILSENGSIYLHCDPTMSHSLKLLMDCIFGEKNFKNEIIWHYYSGGSSKDRFAKKHDLIFFYSKSEEAIFNLQKEIKYMKGKKVGIEKLKNANREWFEDEEGKTYTHINMRDVWYIPIINPMAKERVGYPTQKPLKLLERVIETSSNKGDFVLDPFCGCATTCVAAEKLGRKWIGIDTSTRANELVKQRCRDELDKEIETISRDDYLPRTDQDDVEMKSQKQKSEARAILYGRQEGYCNICEGHFNLRNMHLDRIVPGSKGGKYVMDNVQLLCNACNIAKKDNSQEKAMDSIKKQLGWKKIKHNQKEKQEKKTMERVRIEKRRLEREDKKKKRLNKKLENSKKSQNG